MVWNVEPDRECAGRVLFRADWNLRGSGDDLLFSAISEGRAAVLGADDTGWRSRDYGGGGDCVVQGAGVVCAAGRHCYGANGSISVKEVGALWSSRSGKSINAGMNRTGMNRTGMNRTGMITGTVMRRKISIERLLLAWG